MKTLTFIGLLIACLLGTSCVPGQDFDASLQSIVKPHLFSIARWEAKVIPQELKQELFGQHEEVDEEARLVMEYFSSTERIKSLKTEAEVARANNGRSDSASLEAELNEMEEQKGTLKGTVERILERQIRDVLSEHGIFNPIIETRIGFPPVNFKLERPPNLLVISPRDRIESIREITLDPALLVEEKEDVEDRVDELGVSSLVVGLGGLGATYPAFVDDEASLQSTIDITIEEWLHQYLVFKPLGFLYLLDITGLARNYDVATLNETLVGMVSKELGAMVYEKYYAAYENGAGQEPVPESDSDFNREMRAIRRAVDSYLARGEIEEAEEFMEQKQQHLLSMGYYIRKLNQAYFAFHGTYADRPTSISPSGPELKQLREQSASVKDFLNEVAAMTSHRDLIESIR